MATSSTDLSISGLATGFDWKTVVTQLANAERAPATTWQTNQKRINAKNTAFDRIKTFLSTLQTDVKALNNATLFAGRKATASDTGVASASAVNSAALGTYAFNISQLATAAKINGAGAISTALVPGGDLSTVKLGDANFASSASAGTLTVNGKQITVAATDTLQSVLANISTATGGAVTGSYNAGTDKFTLTSSSEIVLGSASDTSNFFQVAQLYNNGTGNIASLSTLGRAKLSGAIYSADAQLAAPVSSGLGTAVTDGDFSVNGKTVTIATGDTLQSVFSKIATATGNVVTGRYDAAADKIILTSSDASTPLTLGGSGDTSNFLSAAKLSTSGTNTAISSAVVGGINAGQSKTGLNTAITGAGSTLEQLNSLVTSGFGTAITAGTFTVNGHQITVGAGDTLNTVFNNIATATGNAVTATYDSATDKITLTSANPATPITLGDPGDTSNFLAATQLTANSTGTVTSTARLGGIHAQGAMTINGVTINYDAGRDSIQDVLTRINNSTAGVTASYDSQSNRFNLTNKVTGDIGIAMQDVNGNFLAATGLSGGALTHGKNLLYTLNGGSQLVSQTNNITQDSSNVAGLTLNVVTTGSVNVTIGNDNTKVTEAVQSFIKDYNSVMSYIATQTASSTDANGNVTAGILAADQDANGLIKNLRSLSFSPVSAPSGMLNQLASLGIKTNGKNNTIELSDSAALSDALNNSPEQVRALFTDSTFGIATRLDKYLTNTIGDSGTLTNHMASLTKQSTSIDTQIANLEKTIAVDSAQWTKAFQAMETAQAQITQQLSYLTQAINKGTL
ncbi:MAG: flagellar filament capping protein FliD [Verrucomicrobiota bacterium]